MKNIILSLAAVSLIGIAGAAHADSYKTQGKIVQINPVYTSVQQSQPQKSCYDVQVPIYGKDRSKQGSTGDTVLGAIIGGAIGNQFGNGSGKDAMTVLGAIVGADAANKKGGKRVIIGYQTDRQCEITYTYVNKTIINEYDIIYTVQGQRITVRVNRAVGENAYIGQRKDFRVNYQLLN